MSRRWRILAAGLLFGATAALVVPFAQAVTPKGAGGIVFVSSREDRDHIYVMDTDGARQQQLTDDTVSSDGQPAVSPDGSRIAFTRTNDTIGNQTFLMDADGSDVVQLTWATHGGRNNVNPQFLPDGQRLLVSSDRGSTTGQLRPYTIDLGEPDSMAVPLSLGMTTWDEEVSPDGQSVVFAASVDGNADIYLSKLDGTDLRRLTTDPSDDAGPSFSPDGTEIVYVGTPPDGGVSELLTVRVDGTDRTRLTTNDSRESSPSYSPDGEEIVFTSDRNSVLVNTEIFTIDRATGVETRLTDNSSTPRSAGDWSPVWTVRHPDPPAPALAPAAVGTASTADPVSTPAAGGGPPNEAGEIVSVFVPNSDPGGGDFTITVADPGDGGVHMGTPVTDSVDGTFFLRYTAPMQPVTVTDTRLGAPGWTVVGQMSNFDPALIFGRYLGWDPVVVVPGMGAVPGGVVPSGYPGNGVGLHNTQVLASAPDGHEGDGATDTSAVVGATLSLNVPTAVPAGTYTGTLTLTVLS